jgi:uncharacterized protein with FMN-binding domain
VNALLAPVARTTLKEPPVRRIILALCTTATALVLLFGYRTSTPGGALPTTTVAAAHATTGGTGSRSGTTSTRTYDGDVVQTRWGPVQVQITVSEGKVVSAQTLQQPDGNHRDVEINAYAVPQLNAEAVSAQTASIDSVSGATVTSDGYVTSLQSALDAADL